MTKNQLIESLMPIPDDQVVICMDEGGGWDNILSINVAKAAIIFGGGSPFSNE